MSSDPSITDRRYVEIDGKRYEFDHKSKDCPFFVNDYNMWCMHPKYRGGFCRELRADECPARKVI